jgi:hypothetical protein
MINNTDWCSVLRELRDAGFSGYEIEIRIVQGGETPFSIKADAIRNGLLEAE